MHGGVHGDGEEQEAHGGDHGGDDSEIYRVPEAPESMEMPQCGGTGGWAPRHGDEIVLRLRVEKPRVVVTLSLPPPSSSPLSSPTQV